jgi:hypothetical protein
VLEEPLDVLNPSCYDKGNDMIDNIDEFIHVGKRKWDVISYNGTIFTTLTVISKCFLYNYNMRLLLILTLGNKEMM